MNYTELFHELRMAKGFSLAKLAKKSRRHRNTVLNVESGRPVKFKTIAELMMKMGYEANSAEMKSMAMLWLEAVSGIPFSRAQTQAAVRKSVAKYRVSERDAVAGLQRAMIQAALSAEKIDLLAFAARRPEVLSILESVRALALDFGLKQDDPYLKAAEEP